MNKKRLWISMIGRNMTTNLGAARSSRAERTTFIWPEGWMIGDLGFPDFHLFFQIM